MRITISGEIGSGKTTIAKMLAARLGYKYYCVGDFMRSMAKEKGMTLLELSALAEKDRTVDMELDERQKGLNKEDNFVLDSRLGFHFVKNAFRIFIAVDVKEGARRVYNDLRHAERENTTPETTLENIKRRRESERKRYRKYYNIDLFNKDNYDLVIDTTEITPEAAVEKILITLPG